MTRLLANCLHTAEEAGLSFREILKEFIHRVLSVERKVESAVLRRAAALEFFKCFCNLGARGQHFLDAVSVPVSQCEVAQ